MVLTKKWRFLGEWSESPTTRTVTDPGGTKVYTTVGRQPQGLQWTSSEGHPYQKLGRDHRTDIGGPFETLRVSIEPGALAREFFDRRQYGYAASIEGIPVPHRQFTEFQRMVGLEATETEAQAEAFIRPAIPVQRISDSSLDAFGSGAISSVEPTSPVVDLALSTGEFVSERKLFSVPGTSGSVPGEYLNYMFGIAPLISDVQDLRTAIRDREEILTQYARDSGRLVRRRSTPVESTSVETQTLTGYPLNFFGDRQTTYEVLAGVSTRTRVTTSKTWFSGAFTYHLPEEGLMRRMAELDRLYGVKPGSALAWELVPYSWLVDYKFSIGSTLRNLDAVALDGLVMPYGYVMCHQKVVDTYVWKGTAFRGNSPTQFRCEGKISYEIKQRRPANPFGFGISPEDLSLRQVSIIAALGLTKLDK